MKSKCPFCKGINPTIVDPVQIQNKLYSQKSTLKVCDICGLYWIDPLPSETKLSQIYGGVYHYNTNRLKDLLFSLYSSFELTSDLNLVKNFKSKGKILDIGAGRGDFLKMFSNHMWDRWAFDPFLSESGFSLLKQKVGPNVNNFTILDEYPRNTFDLIILRNIIEHTVKFNLLIKAAYRLLKRKGIVFIRTPNMSSLDFRLFRNNWYVVTMPGHIVFFDNKSLSRYARDAGFKIKFSKPTYRAASLAYYRSSTRDTPRLIKLGLSVGYSIVSPLYGEGGDLKMIAEKR